MFRVLWFRVRCYSKCLTTCPCYNRSKQDVRNRKPHTLPALKLTNHTRRMVVGKQSHGIHVKGIFTYELTIENQPKINHPWIVKHIIHGYINISWAIISKTCTYAYKQPSSPMSHVSIVVLKKIPCHDDFFPSHMLVGPNILSLRCDQHGAVPRYWL